MAETKQWEYCSLVLLRIVQKRDDRYYELGIRYLGDEAASRMLSEAEGSLARKWEYSPWQRAIAELGEGGWELVSTQHANSSGDMGTGGEIDHSNAIAYFKRPKVAGRRIDDPPLHLPRASQA